MTAIIDMLKKVYQYAPSCAEPAAVDAMRTAAIEFCERTRLWHTVLTCAADTNPVLVVPYDATPDTNKLTLPAGAELHEFGPVLFDEQPIDAVTTAYLDERYTNWRTNTDPGVPAFVTQLAFDTLLFYPHFDEGDLNVTVTLKPTNTATTIPDAIAAKYRSELTNGALAIVLALPGQAFTNVDLALYFANRFESDMNRLFNKKAKGQQRAPIRTKANFF